MKLADGSRWVITAGDGQASFIVSRFIEAVQLRPVHKPTRRLHVQVDNFKADLRTHNGPFNWTVLPSENEEDSIVCIFKTADNKDTFALQLMLLSLVICLDAQTYGGILLHGALAEREGYGVILAGPGGIGKTTASQRLALPWRSLCDDLTLVVRDQQGAYWAHPWPTWSKFMFGGPGGTWNVQHAVPLRGIFFLNQAHKDQVESVGDGQAVCLLVESTEQAWRGVNDMREDKIRTLRLQRFENICALAQVVPCYLLHLSLTGKFWQEIERAINPKFETRNPKSETNSNTQNTKFKTRGFCL